MDTLQILERYYNTFIEQEATKPFFLGLTDYLDYAETLPEYDLITTLISNQAKPLYEKLAVQDKTALEKINKIHKEIKRYIDKNRIENEIIKRLFQEYDSYLAGHSRSSLGLTNALHNHLRDIIEILYGKNESKAFATRYIELFDSSKAQVKRYLPLKEFDEFAEAKDEVQRGYRDAIWGAQAHIYELYDVIRKGRETHKAILERYKKRESGATYNLLNFGVIFGEWKSIEEGKSDRIPTFFNVKKIKPLVQRFHMHVLAHFSDARKTLEEVSLPKEHRADKATPMLVEDDGIGYFKFQKHGEKIKVGQVSTRKYRLLATLMDSLGAGKIIDVVFEAVALPKDKLDGLLLDANSASKRKIEIIEYAMKELQKIGGLKSRLKLSFSANRRTVQLKVDD